MKTIMFFGDSISAGSNLPDGGPDDAWPMLFAREYADKFQVRNESRGGRPTGALNEFEEAISKDHAPDVLVIALGGNDARSLAKSMVADACANIDLMIDRAQGIGVKRIVIVGPFNIDKESLGPSFPIRNERERNLQLLDSAYRKLAEELKVEFIPMLGAIPPASLKADGVHPDKAGNIPVKDAFAAKFLAK